MLEVSGLGKTYGEGETAAHAIGDVSFALAEREFVCVVGPSGCGKTTLLKCMSGLLEPSRGQVVLRGRRIDGTPPEMALVFQDYSRSLLPWLSVRGNVMLPLRHKKLDKAESARLVEEAVEAVGLSGFLDRYPWQLSGGMQQRVAIARALVVRPDILLMDEPFGALDAQTRTVLQEEVSRLRSVMNYTVMFITHSVEEAVYLGDRVVVMSSRPGRIKRIINIPRDAEWRGLEIEEAGNHSSFIDAKREIWELIRAEIVRQ